MQSLEQYLGHQDYKGEEDLKDIELVFCVCSLIVQSIKLPEKSMEQKGKYFSSVYSYVIADEEHKLEKLSQ